jgi:hypothetical protein
MTGTGIMDANGVNVEGLYVHETYCISKVTLGATVEIRID